MEIRQVDPTDPVLAGLIGRHLELMYASSPACSVHAMKAEDLARSGAVFLAAFDGETPVAMGALKRIGPGHGEIKSMHVIAERRGAGLADAILGRLIDEARASGLARVSLETGSQEVFGPARAFYRRHGFAPCPPFEGYAEDPASVFFTRTL